MRQKISTNLKFFSIPTSAKNIRYASMHCVFWYFTLNQCSALTV